MEKNKNLTWIENIYWYLEDISIVLVTRNRKWYNKALPKLIETWDTIKDYFGLKKKDTNIENQINEKKDQTIKKNKNIHKHLLYTITTEQI